MRTVLSTHPSKLINKKYISHQWPVAYLVWIEYRCMLEYIIKLLNIFKKFPVFNNTKTNDYLLI